MGCIKRREKAFAVTIIVLNILTIVFMIGTIAGSSWVELNEENIRDHGFKGSIYTITEGMGKYEGSSYNIPRDDYCDTLSELKSTGEDNEDNPIYDYYLAGCAMFSSLSVCCCCFITMEIIAMLSSFSSTLILTLLRKNSAKLLALFITTNVCSFLSHCCGLTLYLAGASVVFSGSCDDFINDGERGDLCAGSALDFAVFLLVYLLAAGVFQCIVSVWYYQENKEFQAEVAGMFVPPHPAYPIQLNQPPPVYPVIPPQPAGQLYGSNVSQNCPSPSAPLASDGIPFNTSGDYPR